MRTVKLFIKDIKRAMYSERYRFLIAFIMIIMMLLVPTNAGNAIAMKTSEHGNMNFLDYVFYMLSGIEYIPLNKMKDVQLPYSWLIVQFLCSFITLDYVQSDEKGIGKAILLRAKNKLSWWLSKCFCLLCMVIFTYGILYAVCIAIAGINYEINGKLHFSLLKIVCGLDNMYEYTNEMGIYLMVVPVIISIGITLFQVGISQYISPIIGLVLIIAIDVISVFSNNIMTWGNWGMLLRSNICVDGGISVWFSIIAAVLIGTIGIILGAIHFCKKDIF